MPSVQRAHEAFKNSNIKIVTISIDDGGAKDVKPFLAENHYNMPVLLDTKMELMEKFGLFGTPGTFIANRQGMLVAGASGPVDFDPPEFRQYVSNLAAG
jgi:peroxiredoxin